MDEIDKTNLTDQRKCRLNEISKIQDYFSVSVVGVPVGIA